MSRRKIELHAAQTAALEGARRVLAEVVSEEFVARFFMGVSIDITKFEEHETEPTMLSPLSHRGYAVLATEQVPEEGFDIRLYNKISGGSFRIKVWVKKFGREIFPSIGILVESEGTILTADGKIGLAYEFFLSGDKNPLGIREALNVLFPPSILALID